MNGRSVDLISDARYRSVGCGMPSQTQSATQLTMRNSAADHIMLWFPFTQSAGQKNRHGEITA
jgi:hypothetical protein